MFVDPQSVTVNAVAKTLPAISRGDGTSTYSLDDGAIKLTISHNYAKRKRFTVRIDTNKVAADPLASANNMLYSASVYLVMDAPNVGYSNAEVRDYAIALTGFLTSANILKVLGGES